MAEGRRERIRALTWPQMRIIGVTVPLLVVVRFSLRSRGFVRSARALGTWSSGRARTTSVAPAELVEAVERVVHRPLIGAPCLPRSMVLWALLRRAGFDPDLVLGARSLEPTTGSFAHAWVEIDGVPVNDAADVRDRYPAFDLDLAQLGVGPSRSR